MKINRSTTLLASSPSTGGRRQRFTLRRLTSLFAGALWLIVPPAAFGATTLLTNGSFESGTLQGWTLAGGSVAVRMDYGRTDGAFAAILGFGNANGPNFTLLQTFDVQSGATYRVEFDWAPSPNNRFQSMQAAVTGASGAILNSAGYSGTGALPAQFARYGFDFIANGNNATLRFSDTSPSSLLIDQALDRVTVLQTAAPPPPVPEAPVWLMTLAGLGVVAIRSRFRRPTSDASSIGLNCEAGRARRLHFEERLRS